MFFSVIDYSYTKNIAKSRKYVLNDIIYEICMYAEEKLKLNNGLLFSIKKALICI